MAIKPRVKFGTSGDDTLDGTDQGETSFEFDGNNANTAGGGNDHAFGGRGKDVLVGGPGNDTFLIRQGTGVSEFSGTAQPESDDPVRGNEHRVGDEHEAKRAPSHIVVVIEENHDADQIVGNLNAPYINGTLIKDGLYYSNAHGTDHPSQPNYLELFSGTNPGVQGINSPLQQHYPAGTESTPAAQNALAHGDDFNTGSAFLCAESGGRVAGGRKEFRRLFGGSTLCGFHRRIEWSQRDTPQNKRQPFLR